MLSKLQLARVCMLHQGSKQCRYLDGDEYDYGKFYCKKLSPEKKIIDDEVTGFLKECKKQGTNPQKSGNPLGNGGGCQGFVVLKSKVQGYDQP